ncbi:acyltransferase family protein [Mycobacterium sp. NPDC006124]|uniref:acyltransferase family protein n=1 Tax=Mycobacterium sp. NPDC006124 TaxID=3156729 RepID=UPI0033B4455F
MTDPTASSIVAADRPPSREAYRRDIDALRAVAIVMVVAFHAGVPGFTGGFTGVDVFFVISGFVILRSLTDERTRTGAVSWWAFYGRRVRRLAPAALLMIVVTLVLSVLVFNPAGEQQAVAKSAIAAATSTSNFYFSLLAGDYFVPTYQPNVFLHTWSLSVEEQFYLGVPLLFGLTALIVRRLGRDRRRVMTALIVLVCLGSLLCAIYVARFAPSQAFYLPFGRAYELGIGALLAVVSPAKGSPLLRRLAWVCSALVLLTVTVMGLPEYGFPGAWALIPTLATAGLIWAQISPSDLGGRYLLSAPVIGIGKVSYGWYLWHWPLLSIVATWYLREPPEWVRLLAVLVALGLAVASYRFWEPRFRSRPGGDVAHRPRDGRRTVGAGLLAIAVTCSLAVGTLVFANRMAGDERWAAAWHAKYDTAFPSECSHDMDLQATSHDAACPVNGFDATRPSIVVWGDSYSQMILPGVLKAADGRPVNVVAMTLGACPPFLSSAAPLPNMPYGLERTRLDMCRRHNDAALQWIHAAIAGGSTVRVVLAARWPIYQGRPELFLSLDRESRNLITDSGPLMNAGLPALLAELTRSGVGVDLFGLSPELDRPGPECATRRWRSFDCDVSRRDEEQYWGGTAEWFQRLHATLGGRSQVIDPVDVVCDAQMCRAVRNGIVNFHDTDHLSAGATELLADQFAPTVTAVLAPHPAGAPN